MASATPSRCWPTPPVTIPTLRGVATAASASAICTSATTRPISGCWLRTAGNGEALAPRLWLHLLADNHFALQALASVGPMDISLARGSYTVLIDLGQLHSSRSHLSQQRPMRSFPSKLCMRRSVPRPPRWAWTACDEQFQSDRPARCGAPSGPTSTSGALPGGTGHEGRIQSTPQTGQAPVAGRPPTTTTPVWRSPMGIPLGIAKTPIRQGA